MAVVLVAAGLLLAACSLPGQAALSSGPITPSSSITPSGSITPSSSTSTPNGSSTPSDSTSRSSALAYSQCMRSHGVSNFPDPGSHGDFNIDPNKLGVDPASPQFQAAENACKSLMPQGGGHTPSPQDMAQLLKYAQCMRDHGIADFPDPGPEGLKVSAAPGSDLMPDNPQFQAADKACKQYMPGGGGGANLSQNNG